MSLARSKSAPIPLVDSVSPRTQPLASSSSSSAARAGAKRLRWLLDPTPLVGDTDTDVDAAYAPDDAKFTSSPLTPRRENREDPFSLAGFFPSRPGSPSATFAWLSSDVGGLEGEREHDSTPLGREPARSVRFAPAPLASTSHASKLPAKKSLSMTALDEYAKEVIATEDKIGILSPLARIPSFLASIGTIYFDSGDEYLHDDEGTWEDEQPVSTEPSTHSSIDEAFDADSLHASICLRRAASETFEIAAAGRKQTFDLFSPDSSEAVGAHATELDLGGSTTGWASSLYAMVVGKT